MYVYPAKNGLRYSRPMPRTLYSSNIQRGFRASATQASKETCGALGLVNARDFEQSKHIEIIVFAIC